MNAARSLQSNQKLNEASGMVSIQAHCSFTEAVALMRDRAALDHQTIEAIALAVVDHKLRFDPE
jgi:AmiR/NasT family two-component response regulator